MREHEVLTAVLRYLGARDDVTVWRNNTGNSLGIISQFVDAACKAQPSIAPQLRGFLATYRSAVAFGLPGSADVFGVRRTLGYNVDHEPKVLGQFVAVECKSDTGRLSAQQRAFQAMIQRRGGLYVLARDVSDLYPWFPVSGESK